METINENLLNEIAGELGWNVVPPKKDWQKTPEEITDGEKTLLFKLDYRANMIGKVKVIGILPLHDNRTVYINEPAPSINISLKKGGKGIAQDIKRRLIPEYESKFEKGIEEVAKLKDYETRMNKAKAELSKIMGIPTNNRFVASIGNTYAQIELNNPESVRITIDVSTEKALEILRVLEN
jgi:hypothetical protein